MEIRLGVESKSADIQGMRIERAAKQFEGILINQLLAPLVEHGKLPGGDPDEDDHGAANQVRQVAVEALSNAISNGGGIGIARMLVR